jgi:hypothetical protein
VDTALRQPYQPEGIWPLRDVRLRTLVLCLAAALILHSPLLPSRIGAFVRMLLRAHTEETVPGDQEVVVPVELDDGMLEGERPRENGEPMPPEPTPPPEPLDDDPDGASLRDAGARPPASSEDAGTPDGGPSDAGEEDAAVSEAGAPDAGPEELADGGGPDAGQAVAQADAGAPGAGGRLEDPYAAAGGPAGVAPQQPNVRIYLAADRIRKQAAGPLFAEMLVGIPEWNEVIGGTGIDPMRDFDHILVSGPQLRDPKLIVVALDFNVPTNRMKQAVERAMTKSSPPGAWLEGYPFPVASLGPDGYRRAVLLPQKHLLVLLPASAEDQIEQLKQVKPFRPSGKASIVMYMLTPWRAFRGTGFPVPKRIRWMRLTLTGVDTPAGAAAGGYLLEVEAEDESAAAAAEDSRDLSKALEDVRVIPLLVKDVEIIGKPEFSVEGAMIHAKAEVSVHQVERIVKFVKGWMKERVKEEGSQPPKRKPRIRVKTPSAAPSASESAP